MKNILITGGKGFVGSNLVRKILEETDLNIITYDNGLIGDLAYIETNNRIKNIVGDILDFEFLRQSLKNVDIVVHLAAFGSVVDSVRSPRENFDVNVKGTFSLLNACRDVGIQKIIFASTGGAIIGNSSGAVNENTPPRPISPYGASKLACEGYCSAFSSAFNMNITALRFANVVGPYSWHKKGVVTNYFKSLINSEPLIIYGDGSSTRDYLYSEDLCDGILRAINTTLSGFNVFHLATGIETSIKDIARYCLEISNSPDKQIIYKQTRKGEVENNCADFTLAKNTLGFAPKMDIKSSLDMTWQWMCNYSKKTYISI